MLKRIRTGLFLALFASAALLRAQPVPLTRVHAHNDYEHQRPLFDALDNGFCSVEADIYLVDGQLLVAHERKQVQTTRTLQALYLDPLKERVRQNGGRVYPHGPEFTLLIDLKSDWEQIYPALREVLKQYAEMLVTFQGDTKQTNAIIAIITGNRSKAMFDGESVRYAALDGELEDLTSNVPAERVPWISSNWSRSFKWRGTGRIPEDERLKLKAMVAQAHQHGRRIRFWGSPDQPVFWRELLLDDVDLINTDDLNGAQKFLAEERQR